jgi:hypothetical protein
VLQGDDAVGYRRVGLPAGGDDRGAAVGEVAQPGPQVGTLHCGKINIGVVDDDQPGILQPRQGKTEQMLVVRIKGADQLIRPARIVGEGGADQLLAH